MIYKLIIVKFIESFYAVTLFTIRHFTLYEISAMKKIMIETIELLCLFTYFSFILQSSSTRFVSMKNTCNKNPHESEDMDEKGNKMAPRTKSGP